MRRESRGSVEITGLHVVFDGAPESRPGLLPVPSKRRGRLGTAQPGQDCRRLLVERHGVARPPCPLEMGQSLFKRVRGDHSLPGQSRVPDDARRADQRLGRGGMVRELLGTFLELRSGLLLEPFQDRRVPLCPPARRRTLVQGVPYQRMAELIPVLPTLRHRFDHTTGQRFLEPHQQFGLGERRAART